MVLTSPKNAAGPKGQAFEASHEEAQVSSGTPKAGWMRDSVSIIQFVGVWWFLGCVLFCEKCLKWVRVNRSERPSQSDTSFCYEVWMSMDNDDDFFESISTSTVDIDRRPIFLVWGHFDGRYRLIFFWGMIPHWWLISTDFLLKSTVDAILTVFSSRWIGINRRYQPYSQVGESLSTVNIDRILK